jgi:hypothetical protein
VHQLSRVTVTGTGVHHRAGSLSNVPGAVQCKMKVQEAFKTPSALEMKVQEAFRTRKVMACFQTRRRVAPVALLLAHSCQVNAPYGHPYSGTP